MQVIGGVAWCGVGDSAAKWLILLGFWARWGWVGSAGPGFRGVGVAVAVTDPQLRQKTQNLSARGDLKQQTA